MSVIYRTSLKTTRMQAVADDIDSGAGPGVLQIGTAGMGTVLAEFTLTDPCGLVSGDTLTLDCDPDISTTGAATGTAAEARVRNSTGTDIVTGLTVGTSGTNIIVSNASIATGQPVDLVTATIQHG